MPTSPLEAGFPLLAFSEPTFDILGRKGQDVGGKRTTQSDASIELCTFCTMSDWRPVTTSKVFPCSL